MSCAIMYIQQGEDKMNVINMYLEIKATLELKIKSGIFTLGDVQALNSVNSALVDLLLKQTKVG